MSLFSDTNHEIFLLTSAYKKEISGCIATWIMPATLVPDEPRIVAVLSPNNVTVKLLQKSRLFITHLLAKDQYDLVPRFGLYSSRDINKFEGMELTYAKSGIPIIPNTCGWMECVAREELDSGDRIVVLADVLEEHVNKGKKSLCKNEALEKLSEATVQKLWEKRKRDGERDKKLIKIFR